MIILHYTGMETGEAAEAWLCNPESEVSSHYLVHEDGRIVQMVRESDRAWHAGKSFWQGDDRHQFALDRHRDRQSRAMRSATGNFRKRQIEAVIALCRGIVARHGIRPERVLAHSDVAPGRKIDPGEKFPWRRWPMPASAIWSRPPRRRRHPVLAPGDTGAAVEAAAVDAVALRLWRRDHRRVRRGDQPVVARSSCISGRGGSTVWPIARRWRRCAG